MVLVFVAWGVLAPSMHVLCLQGGKGARNWSSFGNPTMGHVGLRRVSVPWLRERLDGIWIRVDSLFDMETWPVCRSMVIRRFCVLVGGSRDIRLIVCCHHREINKLFLFHWVHGRVGVGRAL